jgi:hypothetical protein
VISSGCEGSFFFWFGFIFSNIVDTSNYLAFITLEEIVSLNNITASSRAVRPGLSFLRIRYINIYVANLRRI